MSINDVERRDPEPGIASSILRGRLGNVLLACNLLFVVRAEVIAYGFAWFEDDAWFGDRYVSPFALLPWRSPILYALFHFLNAPAWAALMLLEWIAPSSAIGVSSSTQSALETAAFVVLSSAQWLVVGYLVTRWRERRSKPFSIPRPIGLEVGPVPHGERPLSCEYAGVGGLFAPKAVGSRNRTPHVAIRPPRHRTASGSERVRVAR